MFHLASLHLVCSQHVGMVNVPTWVLLVDRTIWIHHHDQWWHDNSTVSEVNLYTALFVVDVDDDAHLTIECVSLTITEVIRVGSVDHLAADLHPDRCLLRASDTVAWQLDERSCSIPEHGLDHDVQSSRANP